MTDNLYALVLAGGGGTRLWPMSRKDTPKQLLPLVDNRTMFRTSVDRIGKILPPERICIVTGEDYVERMRAEVPQIPKENFFVEPDGRNSAPAAAFGIWMIHQRNPDAAVVLLTADHHIVKESYFCEAIVSAYELAQEGYITTLGISPTYPATGFGYIQQGDIIRKMNGFTSYHALRFTEKPDLIAATDFVASGQYSWNSGMFIWTTKRAKEEFLAQQPTMFNLFEQFTPHIGTDNYKSALNTLWEKMPSISIDYAIMEGAKQMAVIPADIGWSDVGSWASLFEVHKSDKFGNVFKSHNPDRVILDTHHTMVYSDRMIVTIGVHDLIVVDAGDVLFVCHKDRSQDVREVVNHLRSSKKHDYL
ncbi:MAG: mannose-1-phosphate guanylyltransferase [Phototrophicales bacterium]|nr:mannose-1-phosphate guanylyltransferase [Phototrophicales bacterium]